MQAVRRRAMKSHRVKCQPLADLISTPTLYVGFLFDTFKVNICNSNLSFSWSF